MIDVLDLLRWLVLVVGLLFGLGLLGVGAVVAIAHVRHWWWVRGRWRRVRGEGHG